MIKLKKYLTPFITGIFMSFALLLTQSVCELSLPNYMSEIVNIGIQQNGVEHSTPERVSEKAYSFISGFMSADEKILLARHYSLNKNIYVLAEKIPLEEQAKLDAAFETAAWRVFDAAKLNMRTVNMTDLYTIKPAISAENMNEETEKKLTQSGSLLVGAFYRELGIDMAWYQSWYIIRIGAMMLLFTIISGVAAILVSLISSRIAAGVARKLRMDIFNRVENFSHQEFDKFSTASLITRSTNDVTQIQTLLMVGIRVLCYAPIMAAGGIFMALQKSPTMGWIIAVACLVLMGIILIVFFIVVPRFRKIQVLVDKLTLITRETLNGLMVIRAFGRGDFEKKRFGNVNKELADTNLFANRATAFLMPTMMLVMNGLTLLIIWVGAHQIEKSNMQVGDMIAFIQYAIQIIGAFLMIYMMFIFIPRAAVSVTRIFEVLETEPTISDPPSIKTKTMEADRRGFVEFRNVSFRYEGAENDALSGITFTARPGETVAFIGATGSGKSTITNLIMRFYDASGGEILIGGVDVRELSQKDLRIAIGYVPQRSVLMSGDVKSNICYGNEGLTQSELEEIAAVAQMEEFISQSQDGFASKIAQHGANLSGGQRQRLSIARALAIKPDIFIFDDSFSALDFKTDYSLRQALKTHTGSSTVIIVAQRVSTIMNAEQIFVIDNGRILASGTHKSLLQSCPEYYEIALSQFSEEELKNER